jgi:carbon monoxide dehydrogenase subunit G
MGVCSVRIQGSKVFRTPRERVYLAFINPDALRRATPGLQEMTSAGDDRYEAVMKMGVAGISGTYTGSLALTGKLPPEHYELIISGQGMPGYIQGKGVYDFTEVEGTTEVSYDWDIQVGGLVAGVGQRALTGVGKLLIDQFMKAMEKEIAS